MIRDRASSSGKSVSRHLLDLALGDDPDGTSPTATSLAVLGIVLGVVPRRLEVVHRRSRRADARYLRNHHPPATQPDSARCAKRRLAIAAGCQSFDPRG